MSDEITPSACDECGEESVDPMAVFGRSLCSICYCHACETCGRLDPNTINGYAVCSNCEPEAHDEGKPTPKGKDSK